MAKICSSCKKVDPLSSHRCFIFGKGKLVNDKPLNTSISERLFRRILAEFPELAEQMNRYNARPKRIRQRGSWSWCYWPCTNISIGSAWTMAECLRAKKWEKYEVGGTFDTDIILPIEAASADTEGK